MLVSYYTDSRKRYLFSTKKSTGAPSPPADIVGVVKIAMVTSILLFWSCQLKIRQLFDVRIIEAVYL